MSQTIPLPKDYLSEGLTVRKISLLVTRDETSARHETDTLMKTWVGLLTYWEDNFIICTSWSLWHFQASLDISCQAFTPSIYHVVDYKYRAISSPANACVFDCFFIITYLLLGCLISKIIIIDVAFIDNIEISVE